MAAPARGLRSGGQQSAGDFGAPSPAQSVLDAEKARGDWVTVIRGNKVTEEWADNNFADNPLYPPGTTKQQVRTQNAAFDNFAAPGRKVEVDAMEAQNRADSNSLLRQMNDENKDADRALKAEGLASTKAKTSWEEFRKNFEEHFTSSGPDGKPAVDYNGVQRWEAGMKKALARFGAKSPADLDLENQERVKSALELMDKMQVEGDSNNPFREKYLGIDNPADLFGMKPIEGGGAQLRNGRVIPARVLNKVNSDFWGGQKTNRFNNLFDTENTSGVR